MNLRRPRRFRRLLPAVVATAAVAATIPLAHPGHAVARPPQGAAPPDRVALVERVGAARWVP